MMHFESRGRRRGAAAAGIALLLVSACAKHDDLASDSTAVPVVGARTAIAARRSVRESVDGIGTVAARPGHIAQLSAPAVTRVTKVFVALGEHVRAGAPLVAFDRAPLDAQAAAARAALATAQRAAERSRRLVEAGIAPRKDLDQATNDLARANADAVAAERLQSRATLVAPIAGVVTSMRAVLGATVDPTQPMIEIADLSSLDVLMPVSTEAAARVHSGEPVELTAAASGDAEKLGSATVADVGGTIDSTARAVIVRAPVTSPARQLRIGETVFTRIILAKRDDVVTVPAEALVPDGEGLKVFVLDASRTAHATSVTAGVHDGPYVEVLTGLAGGETVVTYGAYGVSDSAKVTTTTETPAATNIPVNAPTP